MAATSEAKREEWRLRSAAAREADPEREHDRQLRYRYGIGIEDYARMLVEQDGRCAICYIPQEETDRRLHVDHDHETGVVRGLLCARCNSAIGMMKDSPERLRRAASYLEGS